MVQEKANGSDKLVTTLWGAVITALITGVGGGLYTFKTAGDLEALQPKVADRYFGQTATRDFKIRDNNIQHNATAIADNKQNIAKLDAGIDEIKKALSELPPPRTQKTLDDYGERLRQLEREIK